jgi:hypothetical protein
MKDYSPFFFENNFYHTAKTDRFGKFIAHFELYKKIQNLPGDIVECGVLRGNSLIRWAHFRDLLETTYSRKVWGFDVFGNFPRQDRPNETAFLEQYIEDTNDTFVGKNQLETIISQLELKNMELVEGDVSETLPKFLSSAPHVRIALLHIDVDLYQPTKVILNHLYEKVVPGGIIALDDFGLWPGETEAVEEFFSNKPIKLQKLPFAKSPVFLIKEGF